MASTEGEIGPEPAAELMSYRDRRLEGRGSYAEELGDKTLAELELAAVSELRAADARAARCDSPQFAADEIARHRRQADVHLARAQVFATLTVASARGAS